MNKSTGIKYVLVLNGKCNARLGIGHGGLDAELGEKRSPAQRQVALLLVFDFQDKVVEGLW